jgi:hypothetical protein
MNRLSASMRFEALRTTTLTEQLRLFGIVGLWIFLAGLLSGCDSANQPNNSAARAGSNVSAPVTLNIYPVSGTSENPARLFLYVTAIGGAAVNLPLALDTGSAGMTVNALMVFPSDMVNPTGFVFAQNQTSIQYHGITVTNQQGVRSYGGSTGKTEVGNIGYATVSFGDTSGTLTTANIPIFFYYAVTDNDSGDQGSPQTQQGWFGVNDSGNLITIAGTNKPSSGYPACSTSSFGSCYVVSPLKYLAYSSSVDAGFSLSPADLQTCDITAEGSCSPVPALTVGLASTAISSYREAQLTCPQVSLGYSGPQQIGGFNACDDVIPQATFSAGPPDTGSFPTSVIFDTGTPFLAVNVPASDTFPTSISSGTPISLSLSNGFDYTVIATASGVDSVDVTSGSSSVSVIGLGYFTATDYFLTDYATSQEGWK